MADVKALTVQTSKKNAFTNGKYHADRESFYDFYDKWVNFGVLVTGAVAFTDVVGQHWQKLGAAVLFIFALAQLVFRLSAQARKHGELKQRYFAIAAFIENKNMSPKVADAEMLKLAGEEDPPYFALHALAENWATLAVFDDDRPKPCEVNWFRRITRNWLRHSDVSFAR